MERIIICPTLKRAMYEWQEVCRKFPNLIKEANRYKFSIEFINGDIWFFRGNNPKLMGYHAEMVYYDDSFNICEELIKGEMNELDTRNKNKDRR